MTLAEEIQELNKLFDELADEINKAFDKAMRITSPSTIFSNVSHDFPSVVQVVVSLEADLVQLSAMTNQPVDELREKFTAWWHTTTLTVCDAMIHVKGLAVVSLPLPWDEPNEQSTLQSPHA